MFLSEVIEAASKDLEQKIQIPDALLGLFAVKSKKDFEGTLQMVHSEITTQF
jgi:hypothetical protein